MKEPRLYDRQGNKDGEISSKHGNTLVRTLRKMYGHRFATGFADTDKLSEVLQKSPANFSLTQLRKDYAAGMLGVKIQMYS
jgi:hypothetical protein